MHHSRIRKIDMASIASRGLTGMTDQLSLDDMMFASLANPSCNTADATGDTYINIENLTGSNFDDRLEGLGNNNVLDGGAGNDILVGGAGADTLIGGSGIDTAS